MTPSWNFITRGFLFAAVLAAGLGLNTLASGRPDSTAALAGPAAAPAAHADGAAAGASSSDVVFTGAAEASTGAHFTGFCKCSCSRVRNCNTSADCGGAACVGGITCCAAPGR